MLSDMSPHCLPDIIRTAKSIDNFRPKMAKSELRLSSISPSTRSVNTKTDITLESINSTISGPSFNTQDNDIKVFSKLINTFKHRHTEASDILENVVLMRKKTHHKLLLGSKQF